MYKAVLWDWDGTLWDILSFMVETYTEVFNHIGLRPWTRQEYREKFRHDWRDMLEEMGLAGHESYLIEYWDKRIAQGRPMAYPWVKDFMNELNGDYSMGVVSSAPRKPLMRELARNEIIDDMQVVVSGDDFLERKPSPVPLFFAAKQIRVNPSECIYVGDMVEDIQACRKANMPVVAVSWGLHSGKLLRDERPDYLAETPRQLMEYIKQG